MNVTTVYFFPPMDFDATVASIFAASRRKPYGVSHRSTCVAHGVFGPMMTVLDWSGRQSATLSIRRYVGEDFFDSPAGRFKIDRARVGLLDKRRPGRARVLGLSEGEFGGRSGILKSFQVVGAHRFGRARENGLGVLASAAGASHAATAASSTKPTDFLNAVTISGVLLYGRIRRNRAEVFLYSNRLPTKRFAPAR